jgi:DeoR/GlpR family transcriptional regulator of sugar metabolism
MLKAERHHVILDELRSEGSVRVTELAHTLDVDPVTIRRDLSQLEQEGRLQRVHGGAVVRETSYAPSEPTGIHRRIAEAAAKFIPDDSVIFIGPGTLPAEMMPFFEPRSNLTIITNALNAAWNVVRQTQHTLHIIGGQVGEDFGIYSEPETLQNIRADWIILEADGLDAERGLTHDSHHLANLARTLLRLRAQVIVLMPPERLGRAGALFVAPAGEVDVLITAREADNPPLWDLSELGIRIVLT